jgi:outer membrane protein assembly factor BamD (BamD/ComL family)
MTRRILILFSLFTVVLAASSFARAQTTPPSSSFVDPQAAEKANAHEDELYQQGTQALNDGNFDDAVAKFDQVAKMRGRRADAALYWKADALKNAGNKGQALATIAELKKNYPQSKYVHDAKAMEVELSGSSADPESLSGDEEKLLALNAVMQNDPEKGIAYAEKWIQSTNSSKVKDRILFILSQSSSDKAQQALLSIAKTSNDVELQKRAIRNLGMNGSSRNRAALKEIYTSSSNLEVKKAVFQGWLMSGDKEDVLAVAQQEKSPELRKEAIRYLGIMGGRAELRQLYKQSGDLETKEALLQAMGIGGDVQGMIEVAQTDKDPEIRRRAVRNLGIFGGQEGSNTLLAIYSSQADLETKKEVINALFLNNAAKQMVALARKETNPELKRALVQKMSLMSSPEITEYMMEILNK